MYVRTHACIQLSTHTRIAYTCESWLRVCIMYACMCLCVHACVHVMCACIYVLLCVVILCYVKLCYVVVCYSVFAYMYACMLVYV